MEKIYVQLFKGVRRRMVEQEDTHFSDITACPK